MHEPLGHKNRYEIIIEACPSNRPCSLILQCDSSYFHETVRWPATELRPGDHFSLNLKLNGDGQSTEVGPCRDLVLFDRAFRGQPSNLTFLHYKC